MLVNHMGFKIGVGSPIGNIVLALLGMSTPPLNCTNKLDVWSCENFREGLYSKNGNSSLVDRYSTATEFVVFGTRI